MRKPKNILKASDGTQFVDVDLLTVPVGAIDANRNVTVSADNLLPSQTGKDGFVLTTDGANVSWDAPVSGVAWGAITGTLADQIDLKSSLDSKLDGLKLLRAYQAADAPYTTDATLNDTDLAVTVEAGGKYDIKGRLHITTGVGGFRVAFGGAATIANFIAHYLKLIVSEPEAVNARVTAAATPYTTDSSADIIIYIDGSVEITSAGTFILQAAQNVSDAAASTLLRGSTLILTKTN